MKRLLAIFLIATTSAHAVLPDELLAIKCRKEIEKVLTSSDSADKWMRTVDPKPRVFAFKSPTKVIGKWVEIQSFDNPLVYVFEQKRTRIFEWDAKNCRPITNTDTPPLKFLKKKIDFTDKSIEKLLNEKSKAMIYIWSPSMTYSVTEVKVFKKVAKELGLDFIALLDHKEPIDEAKRILAQFDSTIKVQKHISLELIMRDASAHFPSTYIISDGQISERIFGVLTHNELTKKVQVKLNENRHEAQQ